LEILDLSVCVNLTSQGLHQLTLPKLKTLILIENESLLDQHILHLSTFPELRTLNLTHCGSLTDEMIPKLNQCRQLEKLCLIDCHLSADGLRNLGSHLPLKYLSISNATDDVIDYLARAFPNLNGLHLEDCPELTDASLIHLNQFKLLTTLTIKDCARLTDSGIKTIHSNLPIHTLIIDTNENITDQGLNHFYQFPQLKFLTLTKCKRMTSEGINLLSTHSCLKFLILQEYNKKIEKQKLDELQQVFIQNKKKIFFIGKKHPFNTVLASKILGVLREYQLIR
jgi:hypothetical protein